MISYGNNKIIVPISCEEIFNRINENKEPNLDFEIEVSILEIYNKNVHNLLMPLSKIPITRLKIRESKILGIFIKGLTKYPVISHKEISGKIDKRYENHIIG